MNRGLHLQNNTFKCVVIIFALHIIKAQTIPISQNSDENNPETEKKVTNISTLAIIPVEDSINLAKMESLEDTVPPEKDTKSVIGLYLLSLAQKDEKKSTTTIKGDAGEISEDSVDFEFTTSAPPMRKSTLRPRRRTSTTEKTTVTTTELYEEELVEYEDETTAPPSIKGATKEEATDAIRDIINVAIMFSQSEGGIATTPPTTTQRNRIRTRRTTTTALPEDYYYEEEETTTQRRRRPIRPRSTLAPRTTTTVLPDSTTTELSAEEYNYVAESEETTTQRKRRPLRPRPTLPVSTTTEVVPTTTTTESVAETEKTEKSPEDYNYVSAESEETTTRRRRPIRPRSTLAPRKSTTQKPDVDVTETKKPEDYEYVEEPQETTTRRRRRRTRPTTTTSRTTKKPSYNPDAVVWAGTGDEDDDEDEHEKPAPGDPAAVLNNIQKFIVNVGTANVSGIVDQSLKIASLETVGTVVNTIQSGFLNLFGCTALDQLVGRCKLPPSG